MNCRLRTEHAIYITKISWPEKSCRKYDFAGILADENRKGASIGMHIKTIRRDDWKRILDKDVIIQEFCWNGLPGKISLLRINRVSSPLAIHYGDEAVKIVDVGYTWVQIALEGQYYWITSMFDETDRLVEIYIDMTDGNVTDVPDPYFADLYLDYVVHVQGNAVMELDREELTEAFSSGKITQEQFERTSAEGRKMLRYLQEDRQELMALLVREQARLKKLLPPA